MVLYINIVLWTELHLNLEVRLHLSYQQMSRENRLLSMIKVDYTDI